MGGTVGIGGIAGGAGSELSVEVGSGGAVQPLPTPSPTLPVGDGGGDDGGGDDSALGIALGVIVPAMLRFGGCDKASGHQHRAAPQPNPTQKHKHDGVYCSFAKLNGLHISFL